MTEIDRQFAELDELQRDVRQELAAAAAGLRANLQRLFTRVQDPVDIQREHDRLIAEFEATLEAATERLRHHMNERFPAPTGSALGPFEEPRRRPRNPRPRPPFPRRPRNLGGVLVEPDRPKDLSGGAAAPLDHD